MKPFLYKVASVSSLKHLAKPGMEGGRLLPSPPLQTHRGVSPWCKWHHLLSKSLKPRRKRD